MINLAIFASTKGTDLQAIIDAKKNDQLKNINLKFVLSDRKDCYALERARSAGIKTYYVKPKDKTREGFDKECFDICMKEKIDIILCIGYMRIITKEIINPFENKIFNIHPSLLPRYSGDINKNVHQAVLDNNEEETGCTLHVVTEDVDAGPIISQRKVKIEEGETVESLKEKVQLKEQEVILDWLKSLDSRKK